MCDEVKIIAITIMSVKFDGDERTLFSCLFCRFLPLRCKCIYNIVI